MMTSTTTGQVTHARNDEDTVGRFVRQVLHFAPSGWAWSAEVRAELEAWCADQEAARSRA